MLHPTYLSLVNLILHIFFYRWSFYFGFFFIFLLTFSQFFRFAIIFSNLCFLSPIREPPRLRCCSFISRRLIKILILAEKKMMMTVMIILILMIMKMRIIVVTHLKHFKFQSAFSFQLACFISLEKKSRERNRMKERRKKHLKGNELERKFSDKIMWKENQLSYY